MIRDCQQLWSNKLFTLNIILFDKVVSQFLFYSILMLNFQYSIMLLWCWWDQLWCNTTQYSFHASDWLTCISVNLIYSSESVECLRVIQGPISVIPNSIDWLSKMCLEFKHRSIPLRFAYLDYVIWELDFFGLCALKKQWMPFSFFLTTKAM